MKVKTNGEAETIKIANNFAGSLKSGDIILLIGDLGAGKTHFVKGIVQGLGCKEVVTSPTFTIHNIYEGGKMPINHFDMYRLSSAEEAQALGFEEYFDKSTLNGISIVEWPENVEGLIQNPDIIINIKKLGEFSREITIRRIK